MITFQVFSEWREEEPEGEECSRCGDRIYLRQFNLYWGFKEERLTRSFLRACQSCHEEGSDEAWKTQD
jgi:hypothetical protein